MKQFFAKLPVGRLARLALFLLLIPALILLGNTYLTQLDTFSYMTLADVKERDDIEMAIVGSSVAEFHFNPEIITEQTGLTAFCATITNLRLPGAIALTEQLFETNSPEWVVLVLEPYTFDMTKEDTQTQMKLAPLLTSPLRRLRYWLDTASQDGETLSRLLLMNSFPMTSMEDVKKAFLLRTDRQAALLAAQEATDNTMLYRDGFVRLEEPAIGRALCDGMEREETWYDYQLFDYSKQRLLDYKALCEKNGAKLITVMSPVLSGVALSDPSYLPYMEAACAYLEEIGVPCLNMLYAKPELMANLDHTYVDPHHMHGTGADAMSEAFSRAFHLHAAGEATDHLFYQSDEEYLASLDFITNVWATVRRTEEGWRLKAYSNRGTGVTPQYAYALVHPDGSETTLRGYSKRTVYTLPYDAIGEGDRIRVYARPLDEPDGAVYTDTTELTDTNESTGPEAPISAG